MSSGLNRYEEIIIIVSNNNDSIALVYLYYTEYTYFVALYVLSSVWYMYVHNPSFLFIQKLLPLSSPRPLLSRLHLIYEQIALCIE